MLKIYNTLTRQLDALPSPEEGKLKMFVCGPTVFDYIHIGNARTFTIFDAFAKYLKYRGYKDLDYVQNITDIDDKIIKRAAEQHTDPGTFAKQWENQFLADVKALGITAPRYIRATDHISDIIKQVQTLIDKGFGYEISDGIYFDLSKFPGYGKLSGRTTTQEEDGVSRIDENPEKRNSGDFCLWKRSKEGEPTWNAPWFPGRPGWHIEDTAITESVFGPQYDIHGGAQDLIFPHHEAEVTQQEAASGKVPFVKYWMHAAFLVNKEAKMSKSLRNFTTLNELLKTYSAQTLRFYLLSAHWHSPLDFSEKSLIQSAAAVERIRQLLFKLDGHPLGHLGDELGDQVVTKATFEAQRNTENALDDDFNTPAAFAEIFKLVSTANIAIEKGTLGAPAKKQLQSFFNWVSSIFGIVSSEKSEIPEEIQKIVYDQREKAREAKDFTTSDQLRDQLASQGYQIDDTPYGPLVKKK